MRSFQDIPMIKCAMDKNKVKLKSLAAALAPTFGMKEISCYQSMSDWISIGVYFSGGRQDDITLNRISLVLYTLGVPENSKEINDFRKNNPGFEYPPTSDMEYRKIRVNKTKNSTNPASQKARSLGQKINLLNTKKRKIIEKMVDLMIE